MQPLTLRARFILVLVFGAVLPLGVVGYWLARSTERSGEQLLRGRLDETLGQLASEIGNRWVDHRSHLLDIAEHRAALAALADSAAAAAPVPEDLQSLYARYEGDILSVSLHDTLGRERMRIAAPRRGAGERANGGAALPVSVDVYSPDGTRVGALRATLRWGSLLTSGAEWAGAPGSVLSVFERESGLAIRPSSIATDLLRQRRFNWDGEPWLGGLRVVHEPPLELMLAAPLGPLAQPFAAATRRGVIALVAVAFASVLLVTLATTRITGSLSRLASATSAVAEGDLDQKVPADGDRELVRVAAAFNTMTDNLRRTLRELAQQRSLAAVGEFAASLAHEVRNPLSSIRVDLQLAAEKLDGNRAAELVARALRSVDRLNDTVTGALQVARSGRIDCRDLDLRVVLDSAMHASAPELAKRGADLEPPPSSGEPVVLNGDASALEQVFLNLLLNAAQAIDGSGTVRVDVASTDRAVIIRVVDDGRGMPGEQLEHVLEPFYSSRDEGSGLGLPIADRIVQAHGGSLVLASDEGVGTAVTVTLPRAPSAARAGRAGA